ncbi:jupiter microtubule associated homolog 1-like [Myxocyprinus asiaticus]|uniref:jupiter microtubule associated homolog 1-like n=1 Tax=Myxocyprinus asiaticus TaxID=70543 RepID=UPI0022237525|nr:jupiter microtubule associated homolog 1-like [Myxocyprinus asiaticus]
MTTTTTFQGMDLGTRSSSRVLCPPGGGSNICFGTDDEKPVTRKNKMASSIFAEPEDPHAHRRNNPPGGKPTGVLCGEPSAPLRRFNAQLVSQSNSTLDSKIPVKGDQDTINVESKEEPEPVQEQNEIPASPFLTATEQPAAGIPSGRRNPPGGKSSLILG